jgi:hypothetical protein
MLSDQFILGISLMIEFQILFPGLHAMALGTVFLGPFPGEMVDIIFFVASDTTRFEAEVMRFIWSQNIL